MSTLEIFLICFSIILSIIFVTMNAIHNYLDSFKNFVKYVREIESNTLHTRQLMKESREIAKEANELIYTCKVNARERAAEEIDCDDTLIDYNDDTVIAFKRPIGECEDVKLNYEEYILLRDTANGG